MNGFNLVSKRTNLQKNYYSIFDNIEVIVKCCPKFKINLQRKYKNCFALKHNYGKQHF